jgi:NAD(P)-dependent dehydrogenase (short-subunit alcohol dehydrogenase family)
MMSQTAGEVALVTGATRGLGLEIARRLAERGITVWLTGRDLDAAIAASEAGASDGQLLPAQVDVRDQRSIDAAVTAVEAECGRLDVLVNNAGIALDRDNDVLSPDLGVVHETLETNALGAWRMTLACLPLLRSSARPRVVNVSSFLASLGTIGSHHWPAYRLSKVSLNALTAMFAVALSDEGIRVNAACPGWTRTEMGGDGAPRSVAEGADTPVWLALMEDGGGTGRFYADRRPLAW